LAAFYRRVPVGHVEAGLRTGNFNAPWPEEANRVLTSQLTSLHFAPTEWARQNLLKEHIRDEIIFVTGNTVVDALLFTLGKMRTSLPRIEELPDFLQPDASDNPRMVLITGHRRENFGDGFENLCTGIANLATRFPEVHFVYPVHLNPHVREPVMRILGESAQKKTSSPPNNVHLIEPLPYLPFVSLMERATLLLTDSGGVQEEAPSLGRPVLVMRETTERPEAVTAGTARLIGMSSDRIVEEVSRLLTDSAAYAKMSQAHNPYGDGRAAHRIVDICKRYLAGRERAAAPV
jgi:UDP-N-acetylglucosamine 2-epimerase (non-hydrolysing)